VIRSRISAVLVLRLIRVKVRVWMESERVEWIESESESVDRELSM
jgi:hypothetical protein